MNIKLHLSTFYTLLLLIFFSISNTLIAQEIQASKNGDYIIVMPDGSWMDYDAKIQWHKDLMKKTKEKQKADKKGAKSKVAAQNPKDEISLLLNTLEQERLAGQKADEATIVRQEREMEWNKLKKIALKKDNQDIKNLSKLIDEAKEQEKKAIKAFKKINSQAKNARIQLKKKKVEISAYPIYQLLVDKPKTIDTDTEELDLMSEEKEEKSTPKKETKTVKTEKEKAPKKEKQKEKQKEKIIEKTIVEPTVKSKLPVKKLLPENDVMENPPLSPCVVLQDKADEFSGKRWREVEPSVLFQYTDPTMKKYYEDEDFMLCTASIATNETAYKYLNLEFRIASDNVGASYGWLEKDNLLIIRFLDGSNLTLYNSRTDRGTIDNVNRSTTYRAICLIGTGEEKMLFKKELDAIRVMWSTGTEDYEIYDPDLLSDQLKCINKK